MGWGGLTACHCTVTMALELIKLCLDQTARTGADRLLGIRIKKINQKEGNIILPRDPPKRRQIRHGEQIMVPVLGVGDLELPDVRLVMHVPAKDDGAEAEAGLCDGEELFLGDELAAEDAVDVYAGDFYHGVGLEELGEGFGGYGVGEVFGGHFG